jgi:lysophospholipase L1-like esterase
MPDGSVSLMHGIAAVLLSCWLVGPGSAAEPARTLVPVEKPTFRHQEFVKIAQAGGIDLLFLGDSITEGWGKLGREEWTRTFACWRAANFGISGDRIEKVLWRVGNGELENIHPRLVVLLIGVNNEGDSAEDVAQGVANLQAEIFRRLPGCTILQLGILPRGERPGPVRLKNEQINRLLSVAATANGPRRVVYLDIGARFLNGEQILSKELAPDGIHPNAKGYQVFAEAIGDTVNQLMLQEGQLWLPRFTASGKPAEVAKIEAAIADGGIEEGLRGLARLAKDKDEATASAAKASLTTVASWRAEVESEIKRLAEEGDVFTAADRAATLATALGTEAGRANRQLCAQLRADPGWKVGKKYRALAATPLAARKEAGFSKSVAAFVKTNPGSWYAAKATTLAGRD